MTAAQISVAPGQTLLMLIRQITYALVAMMVLQLGASERLRPILLNSVLCIILVYAAYGLLALRMGDTILGLPKWAYFGSITGSFVNRNSFATFVGFGAILSVAQVCGQIRRQATRHRDDGVITGLPSRLVIYTAAYLFLMLVVIGTQSRMGLFATLAGSGFVVIACLLSIRRPLLILLVAPLALVIMVALMWLIGGGLLERIEWQGFGSDSRLLLYQQVLQLIESRPFIGFGGGTFEVAFPLVHELPLAPSITWNLAHNTYLALWSEMGLIAGSFLVLAVIWAALRLIRALVYANGAWTPLAAALGVIVQVAVHSTVDFSLEIPANTLVFVTVLAAGLACALPTRPSRRA